MRLTAALLLVCVPLLRADPPPSAVQGRVVDAQTGEPLSKAVVSVRDSRRETVTDSAGRFRLEGLPEGTVEIEVTTIGYGVVRQTATSGGADVFDRTHRRYTDLDGLDPRTGRAFLETDTLFPLLPSIGVVVEF